MVNGFATGSSIYLPLIDNISYLLYLMENALNIGGLLDFSVQVNPALIHSLYCWNHVIV